jgi:uncharacterized membrane protein
MSFLEERILTADELSAITDVIKTYEQKTSGEIRVQIQQRRSLKERNLTVHEMAVKSFHTLGMDRTKERTGVLIFIVIVDHEFEIIGDSGINEKVPAEFWESIAEKMSVQFRRGKFFDGIALAIREVGTLLQKEFPVIPGDTNELSNDVVIS